MTVIAIIVIVTQLPQMPHLQLWPSLGILMTLCICIFICICICICICLTACNADCGLPSIVMTPCKHASGFEIPAVNDHDQAQDQE